MTPPLFFYFLASESSCGRVDWPKKKRVVGERVGDWVVPESRHGTDHFRSHQSPDC